MPEPSSQNVSSIGADPWRSVGLRIRLFTVYLSGSENWLKPPQASISGILLWFNAKFHLFVCPGSCPRLPALAPKCLSGARGAPPGCRVPPRLDRTGTLQGEGLALLV